MKLMFASDTHRLLLVTERVLKLFAQSDAQWLMILGDALDHDPRNALPKGYTPTKVAEQLNEVAHKVIAVHGNRDNEVDQMLPRFPITVPWQQVLLEKQCLFLTHGHPFGPENPFALNQSDASVYGHIHLPVAEQRGEIFHFNPDPVNIPKDDNPASYGMLSNDTLNVITFNDRSIIAQVVISP